MQNLAKELKASDIKNLLLKTYLRYQKGEINDSRAKNEAFLLETILKSIQITDLENKLNTIKSLLKNNEKQY